jgi:ammonium transporter
VRLVRSSPLLALVALFLLACASGAAQTPAGAASADELAKTLKELQAGVDEAKVKGDSAWLLVSTAFVMLMVPGLALFYGGMVRRKNVLATMMHSMAALAVVGVYWVAIGYSLAFGTPWITGGSGSFLGWSDSLVFLKGVPTQGDGSLLPGTNIPIYLHMLFQGMFAIITPALISGALAERIRFKPYCLFLIVWVTVVYCPLAHMVWAMDWWQELPGATEGLGNDMVGYLGAMGALDFAGGTVVHIAAGLSSLAAIVVLRKRLGYPEHAIHPNSMVLTLTGAGLLWFGWFGFNGGSAGASGNLATSAFAATQAAAAAAGLSWMLAEWVHRGKPTALGLASGIVAGLVAVTPASGYIYVWGGLVIGLLAGVICYVAVCLKSVCKYDDSLDAFGVHGVGGFLGAVLTGVFCATAVNSAGKDGMLAGAPGQLTIQLIAAVVSAGLAFVFSLVIVKAIDVAFGLIADNRSETEGLDRTEHGEVGFDLGPALEVTATSSAAEPRAARVPPDGGKRFSIVVDGIDNGALMHKWSELCQPSNGDTPSEFRELYPYVTTVQGKRFSFRGGDPNTMKKNLERLFQDQLKTPVSAQVEA